METSLQILSGYPMASAQYVIVTHRFDQQLNPFIHSFKEMITKEFVRTDTCFSNNTSSGFEQRETTKVYIQA